MTHSIGNTADIRKLNQELILAALRKHDCANIAELARWADLSIATCVKIVAELMENGQVHELKERESRGGRPARRYQYNYTHCLVAGVVLKVTKWKESITLFVADLGGNIAKVETRDIDEITVAAIEEALDNMIAEYPAIGVLSFSIPGMVHDGVIGTGDFSRFTGFPMRDHFAEHYGLPVCVENDMNLCALGYYQCAEQGGHDSLAYLYFPHGYATGGGMILNGKLLRGKSSFAGELSYMTFVAKRAESRRLLSTPGRHIEYVEYVAKMLMAVTILVNPDVVVLSGDDISEVMKHDIVEYCLRDIPEQHLPNLVIKRNYDEDCISGLFVEAMSALANFPHLLEFTPMGMQAIVNG